MIARSVKMKWVLYPCLVLLLASGAPAGDLAISDGDKLLFITRPGDPSYESFIRTFLCTRFPEWTVAVANSHWPGNPELHGSPTSVVFFDMPSAVTAETIRSVFPRARILILNVTARHDGSTSVSKNETPVNLTIVNALELLHPAIARAATRNPALAATISEDRLKAGDAGHLLIAQALLQAWHAPAMVTSVEIDALRGKVPVAENTTVRELESGRVVAWSQDDRALPFPVNLEDPAVALATAASDFVNILDRQILRIRGLAAEWYRLTIDGEPMGFIPRSKLDEGINLANMRTPMWRQAMAVHELSKKHAELQAEGRRLFQATAEEKRSPDWKTALERLLSAEVDLSNQERSTARPRTHDYELQPVER